MASSMLRDKYLTGGVICLLLIAFATAPATGATSSEVTVEPTNQTVGINNTVTYAIVLDSIDDGVGSYEFNATINETATAQITDVSLEGTTKDTLGTNVDWGTNNGSLSVSVASGDHANGTIATLTIRGESPGTAAVSIQDIVVGDESFNTYTISAINNATVTVENPREARLTPTTRSIGNNESTTYEVVVDPVQNGVGSYEFNLSVNDTDTAQITDVSLEGTTRNALGTSITLTDNNGTLSVQTAAGGHTGGTIATVTVTGKSDGVASLTLDNIIVGDNEFNSYQFGAIKDATVRVGANIARFEPREREVRPGTTAAFDVTVTNTNNGVATYEFNVSVSNTSVATITSVDLVGTDQDQLGSDVTIASDGASAKISAAQGDENNGAIATVTVTAQAAGNAELRLSDILIGDDNFASYDITGTESGVITVSQAVAPPPIVGTNSPTDQDGDGVYEDLTGDGRVNILDVGAYLKNRNSPAIQNNPEAFDLTGDGRANILDIGRLLRQVLS